MGNRHPQAPTWFPVTQDDLRQLELEDNQVDTAIADIVAVNDAQQAQIDALTGGAGAVTSFNSRTGAVVLLLADVTGVLGYTPQPAGSYLTANQSITLSGDASGSGSTAISVTLATVNSNTGTYGGAATVPQISVNGKGLITGVTAVPIAAPWAGLTGVPAAVSALSGTNTGDQDLSSYITTAAVVAGYQPLDADLTAIAALTTTAFGRGFLDLADAPAGRTKLGLGTAALSASGDFQPADAQLTSLAGLSYTGNALKVLRVNAGETGFELATPTGGGGGDAYLANNQTFTGINTFSNDVNLSQAAGTNRFFYFSSGGSLRWAAGVDDTAESGASVGSDYFIRRYDDAGGFAGNALKIERNTGIATFGSDVQVPDEAFGAGWDGSTEVPTKNALYDKLNPIAIKVDAELTPVHMTADAAARGAAIADYFASTLSLEANSTYDIECHAHFLKTTAGTVLFTWLFSNAPTMVSSRYEATPITGYSGAAVTGAPVQAQATGRGVATIAHAASGSLTTAVDHSFVFWVRVRTNAATTIQLRSTESAGTITPRAGSYMRARKIV